MVPLNKKTIQLPLFIIEWYFQY